MNTLDLSQKSGDTMDNEYTLKKNERQECKAGPVGVLVGGRGQIRLMYFIYM
jgi:hypothetical protein